MNGQLINWLAVQAAKQGYVTVVQELIQAGADDYERIAIGAAAGGYGNIVDDMIQGELSSELFNDIIVQMASKGHQQLHNSRIIPLIRSTKPITNKIAKGAARGGYKEIVDKMLTLGTNNFNRIATAAAEGGHEDILNDMMVRGADDVVDYSIAAAKGGYRDMINRLIDTYPTKFVVHDFDSIAFEAAIEGYKEIVDDMIQRGAIDFGRIALEAAKGGHKNIVDDMYNRGGLTGRYLGAIATNALLRGYKDIAMDMIRRGATRLFNVGLEAARSGYKDVLDQIFEHNPEPFTISNLDMMALNAVVGGHKDIVMDLIHRGARNLQSIIYQAELEGYDNIVTAVKRYVEQ